MSEKTMTAANARIAMLLAYAVADGHELFVACQKTHDQLLAIQVSGTSNIDLSECIDRLNRAMDRVESRQHARKTK